MSETENGVNQELKLTPDIINEGEEREITTRFIRESLKTLKKKKLVRVTRERRKVYSNVSEERVITLNLPRGCTDADKLHEMVHAQQYLLALASGISPRSLRNPTLLQRGLAEIQASNIVKRYLDGGNGYQSDHNANDANLRTWMSELPKRGYRIPSSIQNPFAIVDETPYRQTGM